MSTSPTLDELAARHGRPDAPRLSAAELAQRLAVLPGWAARTDHLEKTFRFRDYRATIAFVNAVAEIAHVEDHHPDLGVHYDHCVVAYGTHSAGGITDNDAICAAKVERVTR